MYGAKIRACILPDSLQTQIGTFPLLLGPDPFDRPQSASPIPQLSFVKPPHLLAEVTTKPGLALLLCRLSGDLGKEQLEGFSRGKTPELQVGVPDQTCPVWLTFRRRGGRKDRSMGTMGVQAAGEGHS